MKFALHTSQGVFVIEAKNPQEARDILAHKHPDLKVTKVKVRK